MQPAADIAHVLREPKPNDAPPLAEGRQPG